MKLAIWDLALLKRRLRDKTTRAGVATGSNSAQVGSSLFITHQKGRDSRYFSPTAWRDLTTDQPPGPLMEAEMRWGFQHYRE